MHRRDCGSQITGFPLGVVECTFAGSSRTRCAPRVEPQDSDIRERGEPPRHLAEEVTVHHAAVGRQRVHTDDRGSWGVMNRQRKFADQCESITRFQRDVASLSGKNGVGSEFDHLAHTLGLAARACRPAGCVPMPPLLQPIIEV